jgi:LSD1 subclass zinc finger protein
MIGKLQGIGMKITKLNCTACGAPMSIPEGVDQIICSSCGTALAIERGEGYMVLKIVEKITQTIESSGYKTQEAIRENMQVTRSELQRLQLSQELSATQMQLNSIQAEIRTLQRGQTNITAKTQLLALHKNEYQTMERIRALKKEISNPAQDNLTGRMELISWEISWIGAEIDALRISNHPQRLQLIVSLNARLAELKSALLSLQIRELRSHFPSFNQKDPPLNNPTEVAALLAMVNADEKNLRKLRYKPEGAAVYKEILIRQQRLTQATNQMVSERLSGKLSYLTVQSTQGDLATLTEHLTRIDQDLQSLYAEGDNRVAQVFREKLLTEKKRTQKQIKALEKSLDRADKAQSSGTFSAGISVFFATFLAGITAFLAGIVIFGKKVFSGDPLLPGRGEFESTSSNETPLTGTKISDTVNRSMNREKIDWKCLGKACLMGLLSFLGISVVGILALIFLSGIKWLPDSAPATALFLILALSLFFGARTFLRLTAPAITIRGAFDLPDIWITPTKSGKGLIGSKGVKVLVGLITWVLVYFILLSLSMLTSSFNSDLGVGIFLVGIILGPASAWFVAKRTSISFPNRAE